MSPDRPNPPSQAERRRLREDAARERNWKRWGPYLADRQWATVREDYSAETNGWTYLPHDHARSRAYRWGEDGLLGITDRECRLCFAITLWNGVDPIIKERLFGLTAPEGNHGEDVKELYYYLDATPTYSYCKALYKYPQAAFPYDLLVAENQRRARTDPEFEIEDTGIFDDGRYFDVFVEYAKQDTDDILIRITCANRGPQAATLHLLPTLWQRNTWAWGRQGEGYWPKGRIEIDGAGPGRLRSEHPSLGRTLLACEPSGGEGESPRFLFTDNETNAERLFQATSRSPWVKDAFHRHVVAGEPGVLNPDGFGTKAAAWYTLELGAGEERVIRCRLSAEAQMPQFPFSPEFEATIELRKTEADDFHTQHRNAKLTPAERQVVRQADAGLLWSRQFYHYVVEHWLEGDPALPPPPEAHRNGRNREWKHLYARDVMSMPDKWEYPWFAAWDLAFHCVAMARIDADFAKQQVILLCREWCMHPNGQLPAYEFNFGDVNPPVHAWAAWRVYQLSAENGRGKDIRFLEAAFQKCLVNFTWWVNRQDIDRNNLFAGGFLGLDNVGIFDRSRPVPGGGHLEQADATAWMAFFCTTMLAIALELSHADPAYMDIAAKFFEHFVAIVQASNALGGCGLWDEEDGFYYDHARVEGRDIPLRIRSIVGLIPIFAAESLDDSQLRRLPYFNRRLAWFLKNKPELVKHIGVTRSDGADRRLLAIPTRERLTRLLRYVLDENEFLSPFGIRSLSRAYCDRPCVLELGGQRHEVRYAAGDSQTGLFGGNSNWRGPVWLPLNYLLIEALKRHHHFYAETLLVECPVGSGRQMNLLQVAEELELRVTRLFLADAGGGRPCFGPSTLYKDDPHFRDLVLFHEYFHGDTGQGLGASHQTGWTALASNLLERVAASRTNEPTRGATR
jgi:Glycosyl hydrolase family 63 C-terminal domain